VKWVYDPNDTNYYPFLDIIRREIKKHSNFILLCVGGTGTGKSSHNLTVAYALDPTFTACKERVAFSIVDFIKICNSFEKKSGRGKVVMLEEVGTSASSKNWHSTDSKEFSNVLQTFRSQGLILLMSVPDDEMFLKDGRRLIKGLVVTNHLDMENKQVVVQAFDVQHSARYHKTYYSYIRTDTLTGEKVQDVNRVPWVDEEKWNAFEIMMEEYKQHVRDRAIKRLEATDPVSKRVALCSKCNFNWRPRNSVGNIPPKCPKCSNMDTNWQ